PKVGSQVGWAAVGLTVSADGVVDYCRVDGQHASAVDNIEVVQEFATSGGGAECADVCRIDSVVASRQGGVGGGGRSAAQSVGVGDRSQGGRIQLLVVILAWVVGVRPQIRIERVGQRGGVAVSDGGAVGHDGDL